MGCGRGRRIPPRTHSVTGKRRTETMRKPPPGAAARPAQRRATSYDVAQLAGVSQSAVSRCFKPGASISKDTRARVMKAARRLDYIPNAAARSLITRRSNLVAVIVSSPAHLSEPEVLTELSRQLAQRGQRALLFSVAHEDELDAALAGIGQFQIDGAIAAIALSDAQVAQFARRRVPLVGFKAGARGQAMNAVVCDHAEAMRLLVGRLAEAGHRQFALVDGPDHCAETQERQRGARERLAELGLPAALVVSGAGDYAGGAQGMREIMALLGRAPDAVICGNDATAIGCLDTARHALGIQVPGKMAVAGCNAVDASRWTGQQLTALRQPLRSMAQAAVDLLAELMADPDAAPQRRVYGAELVEGTTARLAAPVDTDPALRMAPNRHGLLTL